MADRVRITGLKAIQPELTERLLRLTFVDFRGVERELDIPEMFAMPLALGLISQAAFVTSEHADRAFVLNLTGARHHVTDGKVYLDLFLDRGSRLTVAVDQNGKQILRDLAEKILSTP